MTHTAAPVDTGDLALNLVPNAGSGTFVVRTISRDAVVPADVRRCTLWWLGNRNSDVMQRGTHFHSRHRYPLLRPSRISDVSDPLSDGTTRILMQCKPPYKPEPPSYASDDHLAPHIQLVTAYRTEAVSIRPASGFDRAGTLSRNQHSRATARPFIALRNRHDRTKQTRHKRSALGKVPKQHDFPPPTRTQRRRKTVPPLLAKISSMWSRPPAKFVSFGIVAYLACVGHAFAIDCPNPPDQNTVDYNFGGGIDIDFLKRGLKVDLDVGKYVDDVYSKYPNADKLIVIQLLASMFCEILDESHLSDRGKFSYYNEFYDKIVRILNVPHADDKSRKLVFEQASRFVNPGNPSTFNLDIRVNNPSNRQISINKLLLRFFDNKTCGGAAAIRPASATYRIFEHADMPVIQTQGDNSAYPVYAYFPYPRSSDCFIVSGNLQQFVAAGDSDRFLLVANIPNVPMTSHNRVVVELHYQIGVESKQIEYTIEL